LCIGHYNNLLDPNNVYEEPIKEPTPEETPEPTLEETLKGITLTKEEKAEISDLINKYDSKTMTYNEKFKLVEWWDKLNKSEKWVLNKVRVNNKANNKLKEKIK